jgi:hypothetical protein
MLTVLRKSVTFFSSLTVDLLEAESLLDLVELCLELLDFADRVWLALLSAENILNSIALS